MLTHYINYSIPPDEATWIDRVERGCLALEKDCPYGPLMTAVSADKPDKPITDRQQYLRIRSKPSARLFTLDNGKKGCIRESAHAEHRYVQVGGRFNGPSKLVYDFGITYQTETWPECERIFVSVGDAVEAYSAQITPTAAARTLYAYHGVASGHSAFLNRSDDVKEAETLAIALAAIGRHLPHLNVPPPFVLRDSPAQPKELGWLNYWSPQTCEYLGFPDPERDQDLLANSYQTASGAWLVKLCPEPLDLGRADHLSIFADTYARFPRLGIRAVAKIIATPIPLSYPQNTAFIHEGDPYRIIDRLVPYLHEHGLKAVDRPPTNAGTNTITMVLIRGASGWTAIKCIPEDYLAGNWTGTSESRLAQICSAVGRGGFMLSAFNQIEAVMIEADGSGRTHVSGFRETAASDGDSSSARAAENPTPISFEWLPISTDMFNLDDCGQLAQQIYEELAGKNSDLCDNATFESALGEKVLQERQCIRIFFAPIKL